MLIEIDDILNTLKAESDTLNLRVSSILGQQELLKKLIYYYTELKEKEK